MVTLFDTHVHYNLSPLADSFQQYFRQSLEDDVIGGIVVGTSVSTSEKAIELAATSKNLFASVGIHPTDEKIENPEQTITLLSTMTSESRKVVAVGEIGLDYARISGDPQQERDEKSRQQHLFSLQLELANQLNLPVILHCRDAHSDLFDTLNDIPVKKPVVFHCMSGGLDQLETALDFQSYVSFAANITYPKSDILRQMVKQTPISRILIETDAPYLPPQSNRGKINHPKFIRETFLAIADIKSVTLDELSATLLENSRNCFEIEVSA